MVKTASTMRELGTLAPDFSLLNIDGQYVSRNDFTDQPLLIIFMCNHCPFVKHVAPELARLAAEYIPRGVVVLGVNSNDTTAHPEDSPEQMIHEVEQRGYPFPYLFDEDQEVAKAYHAACTPDFFLFDKNHLLFYRGQLDPSRPKAGDTPDGRDLRAAIEAMLAGKPAPEKQIPSLGCNIKWKPDNEPAYFNAAGV